MLSRFSRQRARARQRYAAFVREGMGKAPPEGFAPEAQDGRILGDDRFIERVLRRQGRATPRGISVKDVIEAVSRSYRLDEATLQRSGRRRRPAEARAMVGWLIRDLPGVSLTDAAERLSRDLSSLSAAATRLERRASQDKGLTQRYQRLRRNL